MDVVKRNIKAFITSSDITFVIPVYQRNYDWKKENCLQLFNDVLNLIGNNKTHFIGTICNKMDGRYKCVIIDGQQRITSIMLLLKALNDSSNDEKLNKKITDQFLTNPYSDGDLKLKLKPIKKDEEVFKKLINTPKALESDVFSEEERFSNTFKNYEFFMQFVSDAIFKGFSISDIEDAVERLEVVELNLVDENPQVIFESLNSTGLNLTNTDLLRNYLLMSMDYKDQECLYHNYWMQIESMLDSSNMEPFLVDYLILKRQSNDWTENGKKSKITSKNLYYCFKKTYPIEKGENTREKVEDCFKDMFKYAVYYKHFIYNDKTIYSKLTAIDKKLYELFSLLEERSSAILVLYLYDQYAMEKITEQDFLDALDICISYSFRNKVGKIWSGFSAQFSALTVQKLDKKKGEFKTLFWDAITSGRGRYAFPRDSEFKEALVSTNVYTSLRSTGSKYLLYSLEKNANHSKELPAYSVGTVEHILPQTLNDKWVNYLKSKNDDDKVEKYVHSLGNLTLTNYNGQLSNNFFEEKRKEYKLSNYSYTRELSDIQSWTSADIEARGRRLAEEAVKIWKLDAKYNRSPVVETDSTYNLQSDFPSFMGRKPATVFVCGVEKQITKWKDFLCLVADSFYKIDKKLFLQLLNYKDFPGKKAVIAQSSQGMRRHHKLDEGLYLNLDYDTEAVLQIIKCIVEYYDRETNSSYADDVWFTVRRKNESEKDTKHVNEGTLSLFDE